MQATGKFERDTPGLGVRMASLAARMMLVSAAAKRWNVDAASWRAGEGEVFQREESHVWRTCRRRSPPPPVPKNMALKPVFRAGVRLRYLFRRRAWKSWDTLNPHLLADIGETPTSAQDACSAT